MSWGAVGNSVMGAFKNGMQQEASPNGIRAQRDANDPTGAGYGQPGRMPAPQSTTPPAQVTPVGGQQQTAAPAPQQSTPLIALLHAIWGKPQY